MAKALLTDGLLSVFPAADACPADLCMVRKLRCEAAVKCAAFQIPIEPFLHAHHGGNLFLQQVKTIAAPTQTVPWIRDVGVRVVHTVERLRLYGGAGACQSYL